MVEPVLLTPQVLTTTMFASFGGDTGTYPEAQMLNAFTMAEALMAQEIGTFIYPVTLTGTFMHPFLNKPLVLPHGAIRSVDRVILVSANMGDCSYVFTTGCGYIRDQAGYVDVGCLVGHYQGCGCGACNPPYQVQVVYSAGLPSGTASAHPLMQQALTIVANIMLQQMTDPGASEGGIGDPGVQSWSSLKYSEKRVPLRNTAFGNSAAANFAAKLVAGFKNWRINKLGW